MPSATTWSARACRSDKIETLGMGKTQPVPGVVCNQKALKALIACLAPNRRVEVEVKGEGVVAANDALAPPKSPAVRAGLFFARQFARPLHCCAHALGAVRDCALLR